jgi:hypothetical protein
MLLTIPSFTENDFNFEQNLLHWWEFIVAPLYFWGLVKLGKWYYNKYHPQENNQRLFINGLKTRMLGAFFITLVYNLYYVGGDTLAYFNDGRVLNKLLFTDPVTAFRMFFTSGRPIALWPDDLSNIASSLRMTFIQNAWLVSKFSAVFTLIGLQSMICASLCFAFLAHLCTWKFYTTVLEMYPQLQKKLAIAIIYMPSVVIWGSGIFKDTVSLSCMLLIFCYAYQLFIKKTGFFKNTICLLIAGYTLAIIKDYILFSFSVCVLIWLVLRWIYTFKKVGMRIFLFLFFSMFAVGAAAITYHLLTAELEKIIDDELSQSVLTGQAIAITSTRKDGSTYDIGKVEPTIPSFIAISPKAINVTLFRPYPWEAKKIIIFLASIESALIFLYFLFVLFKNRVIFFFTKMMKDPFLVLCILFTLIFAAFVGISSFNFGTLVRYKIPCIPFFMTALFIMGSDKKNTQEQPAASADSLLLS